MGCTEDGSNRRKQCLEEEDQGYDDCTQEEDRGYDECSRREDQGHRDCCDWWPCSWACDAWVWVANIVCVAWTWVSNIVCVAWTWVSNVVCVAWSYVVEVGCIIGVTVINWIDTLFGPGNRVDVHCHFFTGNTVAIYAVTGFIDVATRAAFSESSESAQISQRLVPRACPTHSEGFDVVAALVKIQNILAISQMRDSTEVYQELRLTYLHRYRVVPLMLDLAYCTDEAGLSMLVRRLDEAHTLLHTWIARNTPFRALELFGILNVITRDLRNHIEEMQRYLGIPEMPQFVDYAGQALQLIEVSKRYRRRVFPFLSVDPRRPGILELVKEYVGPKKPFWGIKLYAPVGFSPTDPLLFGKDVDDDSLYRYCSDNSIPITAHCSPGGFGSFANSISVTGHIQVREGVEIEVEGFQGSVDSDGVCEVIGTVVFSTSIESHGLDAMVAERSRTLNHPNIWRRVLERYPNLYLNLAHFGGQEDACLYAHINDELEDSYTPWTHHIAELMEEYVNVYTDISCHHDSNAVQLFKDRIYDEKLSEKVKSKVLYGSDYNILMLFESSLADYLTDFKRIFGNEFDKLSIDNPNRFLFERD